MPNANYIVHFANGSEPVTILARSFNLGGYRHATPLDENPEATTGVTVIFLRNVPNHQYDVTRTSDPDYWQEPFLLQEAALLTGVVSIRLEEDVVVNNDF